MKALRLAVITANRIHVYEGRNRIATFEWYEQEKLRTDVEWARTAPHVGIKA